MQVRRHNFFSIVDASGRLLTSLLALATFADVTTVTVKMLVCINLVSAVFVPLPTLKDSEGMEEVNEPLKEGV